MLENSWSFFRNNRGGLFCFEVGFDAFCLSGVWGFSTKVSVFGRFPFPCLSVVDASSLALRLDWVSNFFAMLVFSTCITSAVNCWATFFAISLAFCSVALERLPLIGEAVVEHIVALVAIVFVDIEVVVEAMVVRVDWVGVVVNVMLMPMGILMISPVAISTHCSFWELFSLLWASLVLWSGSRSYRSNKFSSATTELLLRLRTTWEEAPLGECPTPILIHRGYGRLKPPQDDHDDKNVKSRRKTVTTVKWLKAAARR